MPTDQISHRVIVAAEPPIVFDVFTAHLGMWWPLAYTFSGPSFVDAAVEPRVGGIWFERDEADATLPWGEVRAYEPGKRLIVAFAIGPDRKPVPNDAASEVEVRFVSAGPGQTRVEVEHRDFARHGEGAEALRSGMDSAQGWPLILAELKRWCRLRASGFSSAAPVSR
jgi:uncharacterized protein YndB with AHSA1/START domain